MHSRKLQLPLWALIDVVHQQAPPDHDPCNAPSSALIFSTSGKLVGFMQHRRGGEWRVRIVADLQELLLLMSDLHSKGAPGVCFDSEPDGTGGTFYRLAEFRDTIDAS
jgi:hypothetical protein